MILHLLLAQEHELCTMLNFPGFSSKVQTFSLSLLRCLSLVLVRTGSHRDSMRGALQSPLAEGSPSKKVTPCLTVYVVSQVADPVVTFCETVVETSSLKCFAETPNKK